MGDLATNEGWGWPMNSRKAHYFVESRSLCGRWMYTGRMFGAPELRSPDDCKACRTKLDRTGAAERS